ncbi:hypothetical protein YC2023_016440 [Brassica napus]
MMVESLIAYREAKDRLSRVSTFLDAIGLIYLKRSRSINSMQLDWIGVGSIVALRKLRSLDLGKKNDVGNDIFRTQRCKQFSCVDLVTFVTAPRSPGLLSDLRDLEVFVFELNCLLWALVPYCPYLWPRPINVLTEIGSNNTHNQKKHNKTSTLVASIYVHGELTYQVIVNGFNGFLVVPRQLHPLP